MNSAKAESNQAVSDFIDFYLEGLSEFVEGAGYVTLPDDQVSATQKTWDDRTEGTQVS